MSTFFRQVPVVGTYFRLKEGLTQDIVDHAAVPGTELKIFHDEGNEHDEFAVGVDFNGHNIGFLPAMISPAILALAAGGLTIKLTVVGRETRGTKNLLLHIDVSS